MPPDKITVIIPCLWLDQSLIDMTLRCVASLKETAPEVDWLIVDDGSPIPFPEEVPYIYQRNSNGGYAKAVNDGLMTAEGDILIICNNDCEFIQPTWLKHLLKPLNEGYDISSIRTTDSDGWETDDKITEGDKFGSIWAIKRKVYETLGGLDESYGKGYFEDLDYQRRAEQHGFKVGKNHEGLVHHIGKATFKVVDPEDKSFWQAREKFIAKWGETKL